jgi:hypothetical protein
MCKRFYGVDEKKDTQSYSSHYFLIPSGSMPHGALIYATASSISHSSNQNPYHLCHFFWKRQEFSINSGDRVIVEGVSCTTAPGGRIEDAVSGAEI